MKQGMSTEIKAAIVGGVFVILAACIGLGVPVLERILDQADSEPTLIAVPTQARSTSTPTRTASSHESKLIDTIAIPSNLASGVSYEAFATGIYTFKYVDSAFTAYGSCWSTRILGYPGPVPRWGTNDELDEVNVLFDLGSASCAATREKAIERTKGDIAAVKLNDGDTITLVAGDSFHADNNGEIILEVYVSAN